MVGEAYERAHLLPGYFVKYLPSLLETINIAGAATLIGAMLALVASMLATRGWPLPAG